MKVLVTGGSGFIGTNLIAKLVSDGHEVMNLDVQPPSDPELKAWKKVDILDREVLVRAVTSFDPDYVVHLAARTDLNGRSHSDYEINTQGTTNLIESLQGCKQLKKVVFTSSMLVCRSGYQPSNEQDYAPDTEYGRSKVEMENRIRRQGADLPWVIARPTSIWGPWFREPYRNFFDAVNRGRFVDIGTHYCTKTYGFVGNSVYQFLEILLQPAALRQVYYIGDEPPIFISEWGGEVAAAWGKKPPRKVPFAMLKFAALIGDILSAAGLRFPMTSFRLKNMTTNHIVDLKNTYRVAPNPPFTRKDGIRQTIKWLDNTNNTCTSSV
jgi:GlcNAc-P-P-Und epimerase